MENQAYISHVHLKGYKSIRDMSVDLLPGLNIIIGPNGSGKTNFLEFLTSMIRRDFQGMDNFESKIETIIGEKYSWLKVKKGDKVNIEVIGRKTTSNILNSSLEIEGKLFINGEIEDSVNMNIEDGKIFTLVNPKSFYEHFALCSFIEHSYPNDMLSIAEPARIEFVLKDKQIKSITSKIDFKRDYFFINLTRHHFQDINSPKDIVTISSQIISALQRFTPIEDLRLNKDRFIISSIENNQTNTIQGTIENILTEFKVNGNWLKWNQLSDGTKRMFYMISKIIYETIPVNCEVILIEEPELGIHPDQLYKLMDFLKEQSKEKQIIITTHSPEVLNILGKEELDRIIITRYDDEKGTQMHHLSPKQIRKGQIYIEEVGNLKSFWVHSNLEEYEVE